MFQSRRSKAARIVIVVSMLAATSCGGSAPDPTTPAPTPAPPTTPGRTMSARIDGVAWTGSNIAAGVQNGVLTVSGATPAPVTSVSLTAPAGGTGTFTVGPLSVVQSVVTTPNGTWQANGLGGGTGSGSVTLTSISATGAAGTFSFVVPPTAFSGAIGNKTVTEGAFNVTF